MKRNMVQWLEDIKNAPIKKAIPVLSFPGIQLMGISVVDLINDPEKQANCMKAVAEHCDTGAAVSLMDLSVEAEVFGAAIKVSQVEVPTVTGRLVDTIEDARNLRKPAVGEKRTGIYINAIARALELITDRPVFAGVIGPFSLAGRLMEMTEVMIKCYTDPELVHMVLEKVSDFSVAYIKAYKAAGANGVVMAEPAAGLLSPALNDEFSTRYVKKIIEAVQDENFIVIYHNCGNTIPLVDSLLTNGAMAYHFGNSVQLSEMLRLMPQDRVVMGNVEPAGQFRYGTTQSIYEKTMEIMGQCSMYPNFVISSGCDIPPLSPWENIDSFFQAVQDYYAQKR